MKLFLYKSLIIFIGLFFLFEFTIGSKIKKIERKIYSISSKENIHNLKEKIRSELMNIDPQKRILDKNDAILLKKFFNKITSELNSN